MPLAISKVIFGLFDVPYSPRNQSMMLLTCCYLSVINNCQLLIIIHSY